MNIALFSNLAIEDELFRIGTRDMFLSGMNM